MIKEKLSAAVNGFRSVSGRAPKSLTVSVDMFEAYERELVGIVKFGAGVGYTDLKFCVPVKWDVHLPFGSVVCG